MQETAKYARAFNTITISLIFSLMAFMMHHTVTVILRNAILNDFFVMICL